ncbi:hypothetical protein ACRAWG_21525 [Methylobacterium sp. P31]
MQTALRFPARPIGGSNATALREKGLLRLLGRGMLSFSKKDADMPVKTRLDRELSPFEREALSHYGADSTFLHAVAQGRATEFSGNQKFEEFLKLCRQRVESIDAAIASSALAEPATLYSGHGTGFAVRGSLSGNPSSFVGLTYRYPGYISTSSELSFCRDFLYKRRSAMSQPTLMEFKLPLDFNVIDMAHGGHFDEFEYLLGRNNIFRITGASVIDGDVLILVLEP